MTKDEANVILDTARAGGLVPAALITAALGVTGDLSKRASTKAMMILQSQLRHSDREVQAAR